MPLTVATKYLNVGPIILKVVNVIIFILSGTIYLPYHYLKMSVISIRYFFLTFKKL